MILRVPEKENDDGYVQVANFQNIALAELAKNKLSENGIDSKIYDEMMGAFYNNAIGGIRLMVKSSEFKISKSVLAADVSIEGELFNEESEIGLTQPYCYKCHSKNIKEENISIQNKFVQKSINKILGYENLLRCLDCGNEWKK